VVGFVLRRLAESVVALFLASVVVFAGAQAMPGDPARTIAGFEGADPAVLQAIRDRYGLDAPVHVQYLRWITLAMQGDLGNSLRTDHSVSGLIAQTLPVTLQLAVMSLAFAIFIGLPLGAVAAYYRGRWPDYGANVFATLGLAVPNFWLGLMLILLVAVNLRWLPASGYAPLSEGILGNLERMILPTVVLGTGLAAAIMRQLRSTMIEALGSDYVRTARARGLTEKSVVIRHALRNSLVAVVTVVGLQLGLLISGAVVTERIFVLPGFGRLIIDAVFSRDYPVISGVVLVIAAAYLLINLAVDLLYRVLDPRVRLEQREA
jgi:peptide/nickel transport system permease protein